MGYLGAVTSFKILRVYTRSAMCFPGSSGYLQELMSNVFGDFLQKNVVASANNNHVCRNTINELQENWELVLHCNMYYQNNLNLCRTM